MYSLESVHFTLNSWTSMYFEKRVKFTPVESNAHPVVLTMATYGVHVDTIRVKLRTVEYFISTGESKFIHLECYNSYSVVLTIATYGVHVGTLRVKLITVEYFIFSGES